MHGCRVNQILLNNVCPRGTTEMFLQLWRSRMNPFAKWNDCLNFWRHPSHQWGMARWHIFRESPQRKIEFADSRTVHDSLIFSCSVVTVAYVSYLAFLPFMVLRVSCHIITVSKKMFIFHPDVSLCWYFLTWRRFFTIFTGNNWNHWRPGLTLYVSVGDDRHSSFTILLFPIANNMSNWLCSEIS